MVSVSLLVLTGRRTALSSGRGWRPSVGSGKAQRGWKFDPWGAAHFAPSPHVTLLHLFSISWRGDQRQVAYRITDRLVRSKDAEALAVSLLDMAFGWVPVRGQKYVTLLHRPSHCISACSRITSSPNYPPAPTYSRCDDDLEVIFIDSLDESDLKQDGWLNPLSEANDP